ncbi:MAG: hypothetical protein ACYCX8_02730, partial [Acidimicrobiales bacterium]
MPDVWAFAVDKAGSADFSPFRLGAAPAPGFAVARFPFDAGLPLATAASSFLPDLAPLEVLVVSPCFSAPAVSDPTFCPFPLELRRDPPAFGKARSLSVPTIAAADDRAAGEPGTSP